jgi:5-methylcytosine-specific restriction endonuclease McrA
LTSLRDDARARVSRRCIRDDERRDRASAPLLKPRKTPWYEGRMTNILPSFLSEPDLLLETKRVAGVERGATVALLALLAEVDSRQSYVRLGFSSHFAYCTQVLCLSEPAAYSRITAARKAREFPEILSLVAEGALSLTTVGLLAPHLTEETGRALLEAARCKSKRDVERLVAALHPQPDIASSVRALPVRRESEPATAVSESAPTQPVMLASAASSSAAPRAATVIAPLAPRRYLIRMTVSEETHQKLQRARDVLRHVIPDGDPAAIVDRALTVLLEQVERSKIGAVARPRQTPQSGGERASKARRHVPAHVRRAVWARDQGRCAFVGSAGCCAETGRLEFHHVVPFALGGLTTVENLQLRCRVHNAFEAGEIFGDWRPRAQAKSAADTPAPAGPDGVES